MTPRPPFKLICGAIAALIASLAFAATAAAAPTPPMTVAVHQASGQRGSYFQLRAGPARRTAAGTLALRNRVGRRITVLLDPIDAVTATTLGSAYDVRGLSVHGPSRWTRLGSRRVVLQPFGSANVAVSVQPPRGARPGDYLSGIGVQALGRPHRTRPRGNVAISSTQRYAVGLEVRLPGPRHPLIRLTSAKVGFEPSGAAFSILGRNPGNVILQNVRGSALITSGRRVVARRPMGPGTFVTGTSIAYPIPTPRERPRQGQVYRVRAVLYYRGGVARLDTLVRFGKRDARREETFGGRKAPGDGFPWWLVVGLALLLAAIVAAWLLHRQRERSPLRTLDRALAAARTSGDPLSLIVVGLPDGASSRGVASALRPRLRGADRLCRLDGQGFLVVAPATDVDAGATLAVDLKRQLDDDGNGSRGATVQIQPADGDATAAELLERVIESSDGRRAPTPTG